VCAENFIRFVQVVSIAPVPLSVASETAGAPRAIRWSPSFAGTPCSLRDIADCSTLWRCHSPWNCRQAMTVSNHVVRNRSSKIRVECSASKRMGTAAMAMPADPERCWKRVDTAPVGLAVRLIVANSSGGHYLLPYPWAAGWVNAVTGAPLALHPTHWQHHVETLPSIRAWARRLPTPSPDWRDWFLVNALGEPHMCFNRKQGSL